MAELVDAADSKSALSDKVLVQVRLEVPSLTATCEKVAFFLSYMASDEFDNESFEKVLVL